MMKKIYSLLSVLLLSQITFAQITVTTTDFAAANDNVLVSNGVISAAVDVAPTGANSTWDFSFLTPLNQDTLQFLDVSTTAGTYALYYVNLGINPNRSNVAVAGAAIPTIPGIPITITNPFDFFYNSSNNYKQQGIGAEINGIAVPIPFGSKDIVYDFPVDFGNMDSSNSDWSIGLPGVGYYGYNQKRVNNVDGWGTVITPYGSFSALRLVSAVAGTDTVHIDTLGFGFGIARPLLKEYKWIANNHKIPVLQINTQTFFGAETVVSIVYPDSLRILGTQYISSLAKSLNVFPNPAKDFITLNFSSSTKENISFSIVDVSGKIIYTESKKEYLAGNHQRFFSTKLMASGIYSLKIETESSVEIRKVVVAR